MTELTRQLIHTRIDDFRREAQRAELRAVALAARRERGDMPELPVTIRRATADDVVAIAQLAALDSADVPAGPVLLAESEGELRAALSLGDGAHVADPFHPTTGIVELLLTSAGRSADLRTRVRRWRRRRRDERGGRGNSGHLKLAFT